jgi:hypothetical protein
MTGTIKGFRGQELYIYPPDTYLKPILILSKMPNEFAIMFQDSLNNATLLEQGLNEEWIIIQEGGSDQFEEWKGKLQDEDGADFYFDIYLKHCPEHLIKKAKGEKP